MSREVLGAAAEDRDAGRLRSAVVTSLDVVPAPAPSVDPPTEAIDVTPAERPDRLRRRLTRAGALEWGRRARLPLGIAVAAGLVGALAGTATVERRHTAEARSAVSVLGMLTWPEGSWDGNQGELRFGLQVLNSGPEPVGLEGAWLEGSASELVLRDGGPVGAGASERFSATMQLDCSSTPETGGDLTLGVRTADGTLHEITPEPLGPNLGMPARELSGLCSWGPAPVLGVSPGWVEPDGRLFLRVDNPRDEDVDVVVDAPAGLSVVAQPPLPLTLAGGASSELRLSLVVDECTDAAMRPDAGTMLRIEDAARRGESYFEQSTLIGWVAQQVGRACG